MRINFEEGIFSTLFFLIALIFLIINSFGIFTIPGIIVAVLATYFSLANKIQYSAILGITTATLSFIAQYVTAFCLGCTLAASSFALGGLISLLFLHSKNMLLNVSLVSTLIIGIFFMVSNLPEYYQEPIVVKQTTQTKSIEQNKANLYISTECSSCDSVINKFVQADPKGKYWQPVIVSHMLLARGEAMLRDKGYEGYVESASQSPTGFVPVLQAHNQYYRGEEITLEKIKKE